MSPEEAFDHVVQQAIDASHTQTPVVYVSPEILQLAANAHLFLNRQPDPAAGCRRWRVDVETGRLPVFYFNDIVVTAR